jgi:protein-tyrosine phosphatase
MTKILFVCHGNICRSVMAECVFAHLAEKAGLADRFEIDSAAVSDEEIGNPIYPPARRKLEEKGVPVRPHRARRMTAADCAKFDLLIGMDEANRRSMARVERAAGEKIRLMLDFTVQPGEVSDPWYTRDFERAYRDILRGCEGLLARLIEEA